MSKITKLAQDRPCQVRLPGCDGGGATTVAAHYRSVSLGSGTAHKTHDLLTAWACYPCHQAIDGARQLEGYSHESIRFAHLEGVARTINELVRLGKVRIS